jgi:aryl-alcohol dehydrogenase-like predicted oxidoreductase
VIGAATPDEVLSSLGAMSVQLDADALTRLDEIWPGPGEAPQAYAW